MASFNDQLQKYNSTMSYVQKAIAEGDPNSQDVIQLKAGVVQLTQTKNQLQQDFDAIKAANPNVTADTDMDNIPPRDGTSSAVPKAISTTTPTSSSTQSSTATNSSTAATTTASINANGVENVKVVGHKSAKISPQTDRRIKLRPISGVSSFISNSLILKPLAITNGMIFPFDLRISVNNIAGYGDQRTTHMNQDFRYYTNTPALSFDISGTFTAQNQDEARYLLAVFHFMSVLTKMHTGNDNSSDPALGLPPPMLLLSGLGPYNFNDLPVVMTRGSYAYDPSVDLVTVKVNGVDNDVPSVCTVSVNVVVQNTPDKLRTFNWNSFASGSLLAKGGWK